jgi:hypothetical protein
MVTRVRQKIKGKKEEELVVLDKDETTLGSAAKAGTGPRFMAPARTHQSPHRHIPLQYSFQRKIQF